MPAQTAAGRVGDVVTVHVIARPHDQVDVIMPLGRTEAKAEHAARGEERGSRTHVQCNSRESSGPSSPRRKEDEHAGAQAPRSCALWTKKAARAATPSCRADAVGAGPDEIVLIAAGSSARQTAVTDKRPVDSVIMAIVDTWYVGDAVKYKK